MRKGRTGKGRTGKGRRSVCRSVRIRSAKRRLWSKRSVGDSVDNARSDRKRREGRSGKSEKIRRGDICYEIKTSDANNMAVMLSSISSNRQIMRQMKVML